jgi:hypothetical protein
MSPLTHCFPRNSNSAAVKPDKPSFARIQWNDFLLKPGKPSISFKETTKSLFGSSLIGFEYLSELSNAGPEEDGIDESFRCRARLAYFSKNPLVEGVRVRFVILSATDKRIGELLIVDVVGKYPKLNAFGVNPNEQTITGSLP